MIKNIINTLAITLFSVVSFAQFEFKGKLDKSYDLEEIYLYKYIGMKAYPFDTIPVKRNKFKKVYDDSFDKGLYILGVGEMREDIVLYEESIEINVPATINGMPWKATSKANEDYFEFRKVFVSYDLTLQGLDQTFQGFQHLRSSQPDLFNQNIQILRASLDSINLSFDKFMKEMSVSAQSQYGKEIALFFLIDDESTKENYFKKEDFETNTFALGDFIFRKFNYYFMRFERFSEESVAIETQNLLGKAQQRNTARELVFEAITNNSILVNEQQTKALYVQHNAEFGETVVGNRIKKILPPEPPTIGEEVPNISMIDINGDVFNLEDLRGQVVLIDFWASWCGPCRRESPNVVANYNKYKEKGFTIVSISADKNKESWIKAIKDDHYTWEHHMLAIENNYQATQAFQVKGYPTMFLIDKEGKLINTGGALRGAGLERTLKQVFGE